MFKQNSALGSESEQKSTEVVAEISLSAIAHNLSVLRSYCPQSKLITMVKADAYGHGLLPIAVHLESLENKPDAFGVARLSEAQALRKAGIISDIVLIEGVNSLEELRLACALNLQLVIHQLWQIDLLVAYLKFSDSGFSQRLWLKLDTGMHRLGLNLQDLQAAKELFLQNESLKTLLPDLALMTHFSCADEVDNPYTNRQLKEFEEAHALLALPEVECSLANSAAILAWPESHKHWNRPGIALYGASPFEERSAVDLDLAPVMTLKSKVIAVRPLAAGETVGYGCTWLSEQDTQLAVVAIGYGDGYPRHAPSGTPVLIAGKIYPLVGRVSMDMIVVDLGLAPCVSRGDEVVLWGRGLPIEQVASKACTISYELLCSVTKRVAYQYTL